MPGDAAHFEDAAQTLSSTLRCSLVAVLQLRRDAAPLPLLQRLGWPPILGFHRTKLPGASHTRNRRRATRDDHGTHHSLYGTLPGHHSTPHDPGMPRRVSVVTQHHPTTAQHHPTRPPRDCHETGTRHAQDLPANPRDRLRSPPRAPREPQGCHD